MTDDDRKIMRRLFDRYDTKGWEPQERNHPFIVRAIAAGYLRRLNGRCGFEAFRDSHIAFTEAGAEAMAGAAIVAVVTETRAA